MPTLRHASLWGRRGGCYRAKMRRTACSGTLYREGEKRRYGGMKAVDCGTDANRNPTCLIPHYPNPLEVSEEGSWLRTSWDPSSDWLLHWDSVGGEMSSVDSKGVKD